MTKSKYTGNLTIDLTRHGEVAYDVPESNRLWLPKVILANGALVHNPTDAVIAIRFTDDGPEGHPWSLQDGFRTSEGGDFTKLHVTVIQPGANSKLYLSMGYNVTGGYANGDGLSPNIGGSTDSSFVSTGSSNAIRVPARL